MYFEKNPRYLSTFGSSTTYSTRPNNEGWVKMKNAIMQYISDKNYSTERFWQNPDLECFKKVKSHISTPVVIPEQKNENSVNPEQKKENMSHPEQKKENSVIPEQKKENSVNPEQKNKNSTHPEQKKEDNTILYDSAVKDFWNIVKKIRISEPDDIIITINNLNIAQRDISLVMSMVDNLSKELSMIFKINNITPLIPSDQYDNLITHIIFKGYNFYSEVLNNPDICLYLIDNHYPIKDWLATRMTNQ